MYAKFLSIAQNISRSKIIVLQIWGNILRLLTVNLNCGILCRCSVRFSSKLFSKNEIRNKVAFLRRAFEKYVASFVTFLLRQLIKLYCFHVNIYCHKRE